MSKAPSRETRIHSIASCTQKTLLPLFAVGGSLAAAPGNALELGDAVVQSRLGQPLRASIAFALAPNEKLADTCVSLHQGPTPSGLPNVGRATISIVDGTLLLRGSQPIREPMVSANVVVKCPATANLSREYMIFIDPPGIEMGAPAAAAAVSPVENTDTPADATRSTSAAPTARETRPAVAADTGPTARAAPRRAAAQNKSKRAPIGQSTRYQVQPGDSLSEITQRIENRSMALWPAVNLIFEANPDAFIDNDPNKLKAGSWLTIPSLDGSRPVVTNSHAPAAAAAEDPAVAAAEVDIAAADITAPGDAVAPEESAEAAVNEAPDPLADFASDLQPADAAAPADNSVVTTPENETMVIPDVALEGPQTTSVSPNITTAAIANETAEAPSSSWMLWLAALGVAVILALLLFGRTLRDRFTRDHFGDNTELPMPIKAPRSIPEPEGIEVIERVDWNLGDDSPTVENRTLDVDADLIMGTGLNEALEANPVNEVGFPVPTELDIELPEEPEILDDFSETDIGLTDGAGQFDVTVESEQLKEDDADDLSFDSETVEMPLPEDDDFAELETIDVEPIDENLILNDNSVDPSIAFDILEQDYEDELSATQALSKEAAQAVMELTAVTKSMSEKTAHLGLDDDATAALSLASITELDFATSKNDESAANDDASTELSLDEPTVEMPSMDDDKTEIMSRKRRKVDSKAG